MRKNAMSNLLTRPIKAKYLALLLLLGILGVAILFCVMNPHKSPFHKPKDWLKSAEEGNVIAQYYLGNRSYNARDYNEAVKWYHKAAEQGHTGAQIRLGDCYFNGEDIGQDYDKAMEWYRKAAEQGNKEARIRLGDCYYTGNGVKKDYKEAAEWYRKAATYNK